MSDITIIMPSYNKAKYICEALNSVFMQETKYSYSIIIADDCSTDNTCEIVKGYQNKYPDKILFLKSEKNQGLYKNVLRAYALAKSDYFCVLDPDDYWVDKHKIEKALDFLESHKNFTIYTSSTYKLDKNGIISVYNTLPEKDTSYLDYLKGKAVLGHTLGSVFRNVVFKKGLPEKLVNPINNTFQQTFRGDSFRNLIHIHEGLAHSVSEHDAVYRITNEGLWQGSTKIEQLLLNSQLYVNAYLYYDKADVELLVTGYKLFGYCRNNVEDLFFDEQENIINQYLNLKNYFAENINLIESNITNNCPIKIRLMYILYKKLKKKLSKKGLV